MASYLPSDLGGQLVTKDNCSPVYVIAPIYPQHSSFININLDLHKKDKGLMVIERELLFIRDRSTNAITGWIKFHQREG